MHRLLLLGLAAVATGGAIVFGGMTSASAAGGVGAFGTGTFVFSGGAAVVSVDATKTGDGVGATGTVRLSYPAAGVTYNSTAGVLCVKDTGGLVLVGSVISETNLPAGPGAGLVIVIQDSGAGGSDRVGFGFEPAPVTRSTSECEVSPTIFPLSTLSSGDFRTEETPPAPPTTQTAPAPATTTPTKPAAAVRPVIAKPVITPRPVAGKTVLVSFAVTRSDTAAKLTSGKMTCDPSVNGKVVKHAEQFDGGMGTLRFTIPRTAKGQTLKVRLTIRVGTQSATRVASFRVG